MVDRIPTNSNIRLVGETREDAVTIKISRNKWKSYKNNSTNKFIAKLKLPVLMPSSDDNWAKWPKVTYKVVPGKIPSHVPSANLNTPTSLQPAKNFIIRKMFDMG